MTDHIVDANKKVPWECESTPLTDVHRVHAWRENKFGEDLHETISFAYDYARNLERRMRAAEAYMAEVDAFSPRLKAFRKAHLEAAKKEDEE